MALILEGIRVLDLTRILAGPWATQNLADLGAEVIKIEKPREGDDTRHMGPPFIHDQHTGAPADAAYFLAANRGKESVAIDISTIEGRLLIRQLVAKCDILIENYKVDGLKKYGLDYDSLRADFPNLIYCSVTGFGQTGPYRQRAGYDYLIQGMGGLMSVTGERDQEPGGGPQRAGVALADIMTGMYATVAMLAALRHRDQGGGGQHIDIGMLDVQVAVLANVGMNYLTTGVVPQRMGNGHPSVVPYQSFKTSDGHVIFAVGNDAQFKRMCVAMGQAQIAQHPNFSTNAARVVHRGEILEILQQIILARTTNQWVDLMESVDVPCGPINALDSVFKNPQVVAREVQQTLSHPVSGSVPTVANPIKFSETPIVYGRAPPVLSQHTDVVLKRVLNLSEDSLSELKTKKIIGDTP
jgi:crotonobetainyl-CoA:carnitine CoA-transferase CaiB-like acyl-CoA transferase